MLRRNDAVPDNIRYCFRLKISGSVFQRIKESHMEDYDALELRGDGKHKSFTTVQEQMMPIFGECH